MKTANKIKRALRGKRLTYANVERILKELGYSVIFFNTYIGDMEIDRYNLEHQKSTLKAFTYSQTAHIVFINGNLHSNDKLYLLLHELGHICLGHLGDNKLGTRNQILIDIEADNFAYSIIYGNKNNYLYVLISAIILSASIFISSTLNTKTKTAPVYTYTESVKGTEPPEQPTEATADVVYVTPSGNKFHRADCYYINNRTTMELPRTKAAAQYAPCVACNP